MAGKAVIDWSKFNLNKEKAKDFEDEICFQNEDGSDDVYNVDKVFK